MSALLEGRVALVTGGGGGIGSAICETLARQGCSVVVNDLGVNLDGSPAAAQPADEVASRIRDAGGVAEVSGVDITDYAAVGDLIASTVERHGSLDIVVNTAGVLRDRMIFNMSPQEWDTVINVHLNGAFNLAKHASRHWREQRNPDGNFRLINFTSVSGIYGNPGQPNYAAAKMGIIGLTYSLAHSLGRYGVTVNAVSPLAATRMTASIPENSSRTPAGANRSPDNVATLVAFLARPDSRWLTGRVVESRGLEVSLYSDPIPVSRIMSDRPWDLDRLAEAAHSAFSPLVDSSYSIPTTSAEVSS